MNKSESISALACSLAKAQGELENADKNAENPHFRSRYADLAEVLNTVRPVFSKHGLSFVQLPSYAEGLVSVESVLMHESGEWISSVCSTPVQRDDPQGIGSAIKYMRRYGLESIAGVGSEDDDGAAAMPRNVRKPAPAMTPEQIDEKYQRLISSVREAKSLILLRAIHQDAIRFCQSHGLDGEYVNAVTEAKDERKSQLEGAQE